MPIVPSRSRRIQDLLLRLASPQAAERDSAVASLSLLGPRVIEPIAAFLPGAGRAARLCALEVLERLAEPAALPAILDLVRGDDDVVALRALEAAGERPDPRAVGALAKILAGPAPAPRRRGAAVALARLQAAGLVEALDPLAARLLDEREDASLRVAILDALLAARPPLAPAALRPLMRRLLSSSEPELAARAGSPATARGEDLAGRLVGELVAPGLTPEAAARVAAALARRGAPAIPAVLRALEGLGPVRRADAASLRARVALHEALAALDSRVALYDLRETIEARPSREMARLLEVAARIGDATLVGALARAATEDPALRGPCREAFASIARREKLRRTSAALKSVRPAHRRELDGFFDSLPRRRG